MRVSLVSLSSPLTEEQLPMLKRGINYLEDLGLQPIYSEKIFSLEKRLATEKTEELMRAYIEDDTAFILSVRGGASCIEILDKLDYKRILEANPKPILGYSDLTTLALALRRKADDYKLKPVPFYHSPMLFEMGRWFLEEELGAEFNEEFGKLDEELRASKLMAYKENRVKFEDFLSKLESSPLELFQSDKPVLGANLSVLCSLLGTEYLPSFKDKILFLEEVNEPLYKMERMFYQLHLAGVFQDVKELWLGSSVNAELPMDLIQDFANVYDFKISKDLPMGHGDLNFISRIF